jgi:hypothetical protein
MPGSSSGRANDNEISGKLMSGDSFAASSTRLPIIVLCSISNTIKQVTQKHSALASNHALISISFVYFPGGNLINLKRYPQRLTESSTHRCENATPQPNSNDYIEYRETTWDYGGRDHSTLEKA